MSKCPCKVIHRYFVLTNIGWLECNSSLWKIRRSLGLLTSPPSSSHEVDDLSIFPCDVTCYRECIFSCAYSYALNERALPVLLFMECYIEKENN